MRVYETVLYADDVRRTTAFYAEVLGLRVVDEDDIASACRLDDGGVLLLFDPRRSAQPDRPVPSHGTQGAGHVAFMVDALDPWVESLRARGIEIEREIEWPRGARSIYVRDPAGNSVELIEREAWPD